MELNTKQKKQLLWLLGIAVALPVSILALTTIVELRSRADTKPENVRETNKGINRFAISWRTSENTLGKILWGTSKDNLTNVAQDDRTQAGENAVKRNHHVTVNTSTPTAAVTGSSCNDPVCIMVNASASQVGVGQHLTISWNVTGLGAGSAVSFEGGFGQDTVDPRFVGATGSEAVPTLEAGPHTYIVKAEDGVSGTQHQESITVQVLSCDPPTNFDGNAISTTQIALAWTPRPGAFGYLIERRNPDNTTTAINIFSGTQGSHTDSGLQPGTRYHYKIKTYCGGSQFSAFTPEIPVDTASDPVSTISGNVWKDINRNTIKDPGEENFPGVAVGVPNQTDPQPAITDINGNYMITNVRAGTYDICVVLPSGWTFTVPISGCSPVVVPPSRSSITFGLAPIASPSPSPSPSPGTLTISHTCSASGLPAAPVRYNFSWTAYQGASSYQIQVSASSARNADGSLQSPVLNQSVAATTSSISGVGGTLFVVVKPDNFGTYFPLPPAAAAYSAFCPPITVSPSPSFSPSPSPSRSPSPSPPVSPSPPSSPPVSPSGSPSIPPSGSPLVTPSPTEPPVPAGFTRYYYLIESNGIRYGGSVNNLVQGGVPLFIDIPSQISGASSESTCLSGSGDTANCPDAAFGLVRDSANNPVSDAIVTVTLTHNGQTSAPITAITNDQGKYAVDLGIATQQQDLRQYLVYNRNQTSTINARADAFDGRSQTINSTTAADKPLPDIVFAGGSASPSSSASTSPTSSGTATPTGSATATPTGSATASPFPTGTRTPTPFPTLTPLPTRTPFPTIAPSPTPTGKRITLITTFEGKDVPTQYVYTELTNVTTGEVDSAVFSGRDRITLAMPQLETGRTYKFTLKGYQHLAVAKSATILPEETVIDFGFFTTGDIAPWPYKNQTLSPSTQAVAIKLPQDDLVEAALDYTVLKGSLNDQYILADLNGNGTVDIVDLSLLKKNLEKKGDILKAKELRR